MQGLRERGSQDRKTKKIKVYTNPELAKFQPRELMDELRARGFRGELEWIKKVKI